MKFLHTIVSFIWDSKDWSFCLDVDLCPLVWKLGVGLDLPEPGNIPERRISINIPTLRLEFRWMRQSEVDEFLDVIDDDDDLL